jgi:hypothetical protein
VSSGGLTVSSCGISTTTLTSGQVIFVNGSNPVLQNQNLTWDNSNNRLGIGKTNPGYPLDVSGNVTVMKLIAMAQHYHQLYHCTNIFLTFSNPFLNTCNTVTLRYNSSQFHSIGNLSLTSSSSYLPLSGGTLIGDLTLITLLFHQ